MLTAQVAGSPCKSHSDVQGFAQHNVQSQAPVLRNDGICSKSALEEKRGNTVEEGKQTESAEKKHTENKPESLNMG